MYILTEYQGFMTQISITFSSLHLKYELCPSLEKVHFNTCAANLSLAEILYDVQLFELIY